MIEPGPKLDPCGTTVHIGPDGLVRVDGIAVFRRVVTVDGVRLQFCDGDRMRSSCRGTRLVEVPLEVIAALLAS